MISTKRHHIFYRLVLPLLLANLIAMNSNAAGITSPRETLAKTLAVCTAIRQLDQNHRTAEIAARALPERRVTLAAHTLETSLGQSALVETRASDYDIAHYRDKIFQLSRIDLFADAPRAWIYSTTIGSLQEPLIWVFTGKTDGSKPDHLIAQLGFENSGHFDTYFMRIQGQPYAIEHFNTDHESQFDIYSLDPAMMICSISP